MKELTILCLADLTAAPEVRSILEQCGSVRYAPATVDSLRKWLPETDAYYASLHVQLTGDLIALAPRLKVIATPSTGLDHLDLSAIHARNIAVLGLKDDRELLDRITATAELAWALLLACARLLPSAFDAAKSGNWARDLFRGHQLADKTLGILGCGRLGTIVAQYGRAFRMRVLGCDLRPITLPGVEMVSMDRLVRESDVLSIHIHLTDENRRLIGREVFEKMKPGAILINTSRGVIVDESAMLEALERGRLLAAGVDVIEGEWREDLINHPLIAYARTHKNLIITPHIGGVTWESQMLAYAAAARKLVEYLRPK